jgi:hypothetical protein
MEIKEVFMRDQCMQTEIYNQTVMLWKESLNSTGQ